MNENVENLILAQLQNIRARLDGMDLRMERLERQMEAGFNDVNARVDGNTMIIRSLAISIHMVDARVDTLEERLK